MAYMGTTRGRLLWFLMSSAVIQGYVSAVDGRRLTDASSGITGEKQAPLGSWNMCPPNSDRVRCFEKYLALWVRARGKRSIHRPVYNVIDTYSAHCWKTSDPRTCIHELVQTLHDREGSRTLSDDQFDPDLCPEGSTREQCYQMLRQQETEPAFENDNIKRSNDLGLQMPEEDMSSRSKRQMCPESMDRVKCFESFLGGYLRTLVGQERGHSRIPGKRGGMATRALPLCPPNMNRVVCFDHVVAMFLRVMQNRNGAFEQPS